MIGDPDNKRPDNLHFAVFKSITKRTIQLYENQIQDCSILCRLDLWCAINFVFSKNFSVTLLISADERYRVQM